MRDEVAITSCDAIGVPPLAPDPLPAHGYAAPWDEWAEAELQIVALPGGGLGPPKQLAEVVHSAAEESWPTLTWLF